MSNPKQQPAQNDLETLAEAIRSQNQTQTDLTAALVASLPQRKVTAAEFKTRSVYNPSGRKRTMTVNVIKNGYQLDERTLTDAECDLLPKLRAGRFINGLVTVSRDNTGPMPVIRISYPCATADQRSENKNYWRSLSELLTRLTTEDPIKED